MTFACLLHVSSHFLEYFLSSQKNMRKKCCYLKPSSIFLSIHGCKFCMNRHVAWHLALQCKLVVPFQSCHSVISHCISKMFKQTKGTELSKMLFFTVLLFAVHQQIWLSGFKMWTEIMQAYKQKTGDVKGFM